MFEYEYPHPAVTVDCVVFGLDGENLKILLIERGMDPFQGSWALPGGFIEMDEDLEVSARRELQEETGVKNLYLEQLHTFGKPGRDPRERVITIAYFAIVNLFDHPAKAGTDASKAEWFSVEKLPSLAFDHKKIFKMALERLQSKLRYKPLVFEFLPNSFTLRQVQHLYETILCRNMDKRNFRKKIMASGLLIPLDKVEKDVSHRAAQLFKFDNRQYKKRLKEGYEFII